MNAPDFSQMTRREIEDYLIELCTIDPSFRKRFMENPSRTLSEMGIAIGGDVEVRVLEERPKTFYVVIPRVLTEVDEELDDEELDLLSGGTAQQDYTRFFKGYY